MSGIELLAEGSAPKTANSGVVWPSRPKAETGDVISDLSPMLTEIGPVADAAVDLIRFATAAYIADERIERPPSFNRTLEVAVQVTDLDRWGDGALDVLADLLEATTGDRWELEAVAADPLAEPEATRDEPRRVDRIALLSGGLDSFAGAALTSETGNIAYLGHWDIPTVKGAQNKVRDHFRDLGRPLDYVQLQHGLRTGKREHSQRTRAVLFKSLAVALATARGARVVEVPENGFTSLNPPLGPERGGPLTTRSTHPMTISAVNGLLAAIGLDIRVENPHQWRTKGELVDLASGHLPQFAEGVAKTYSCAKMDGGRYRGGDWNKHCGLCYACMVRRGAIAASGVADATDYLCNSLAPDQQLRLIERRRVDIDAVKMALEVGVSDLDVLALGPFPADFDLDDDLARAVDLCRRGFDEIRRVALP